MATGSGRLPTGKSGVDLTVQLDVPWNAPEVFVHMEFAGLHELNTQSMPDMLGLRNPAAGSSSDSRHDWGVDLILLNVLRPLFCALTLG